MMVRLALPARRGGGWVEWVDLEGADLIFLQELYLI